METQGLIKTKKCPKCGRELPVTEFYKRSDAPDGLQGWCKKCQCETAKLNRKYESGGGNIGGIENVHVKAAHGRVGKARVHGRIEICENN